MNVSKILKEVERLSPVERRQVLEVLQKNGVDNYSDEKRGEFYRRLVAKGILKAVPPRSNLPRTFEPVPILGKPISETIIEERD